MRHKMNLVHICIICILRETCCWLDVLAPYPIKASNDKKVKTSLKPSEECRKDRHCLPTHFCNRYEKTCTACKNEGEMCRRNKMCCRGFECAAGRCRKEIELGREGAFCNKDRDCNYGFCCARENGQSVCKPLLREGDECGIPAGGKKYFWSHQCPCFNGLRCKEKEVEGETSMQKLTQIAKDWRTGIDYRCQRVT